MNADGQVSRPLRIKSNWMLEQICLLETWMKMSTNDYYTTPSVLLGFWQRLRRYGFLSEILTNRSDDLQ